MKSKTFLTLSICAATAALFSGCSTQKTGSGSKNSFLGGLVTRDTGSYRPIGPNTIPFETTQVLGRVNPSGNQTTIGWGLVTLHDY